MRFSLLSVFWCWVCMQHCNFLCISAHVPYVAIVCNAFTVIGRIQAVIWYEFRLLRYRYWVALCKFSHRTRRIYSKTVFICTVYVSSFWFSFHLPSPKKKWCNWNSALLIQLWFRIISALSINLHTYIHLNHSGTIRLYASHRKIFSVKELKNHFPRLFRSTHWRSKKKTPRRKLNETKQNERKRKRK